MYDRLYTLEISHPKLTNNLLRIEGDSSRLSHNIDFSSTLMMSGGCLGGTVTIYGLPTDTINKLSVLSRDRFVNGLTANEYRLRLSVGAREMGEEGEGKKSCILDGFVMECLPGPLPERSLRFTVSAGNIYSRLMTMADNEKAKKEIGKMFITIKDFAKLCKSEIEKNDDKVNITIDDEWRADRKILNLEHPTDADSFVKRFLIPYGIPYEDMMTTVTVSSGESESQHHIRHIDVGISDENWRKLNKKLEVEISEPTGMIGLPASADHGATVNVLLKVPIALGSVCKLISKVSPTFNHEDYVVRQVQYSGNFYGDNWSQQLQLYRGH